MTPLDKPASGLVDLHTHSNFSDGRLSPAELVEEAVWKGLSAIALTDHDNIDGLDAAQDAGRVHGIEIVAGVELSCEFEDREVHMLGLFITPDDELRTRLRTMHEMRENRMLSMLDRLREIGIDIPMEEIPQASGKSFGRPHLAQALVRRGIVRSISEAFARFIGDDGPAYVPKDRFGVPEGVKHIHRCGGVAILAHPGVQSVFNYLPCFLEEGIDGIEAYYPKHTEGVTAEVLDFCKRHDLVVSGGSDFHANGEGPDIGVPPVSAAILEPIRERAALRARARGA